MKLYLKISNDDIDQELKVTFVAARCMMVCRFPKTSISLQYPPPITVAQGIPAFKTISSTNRSRLNKPRRINKYEFNLAIG